MHKPRLFFSDVTKDNYHLTQHHMRLTKTEIQEITGPLKDQGRQKKWEEAKRQRDAAQKALREEAEARQAATDQEPRAGGARGPRGAGPDCCRLAPERRGPGVLVQKGGPRGAADARRGLGAAARTDTGAESPSTRVDCDYVPRRASA